ncbi:MAG: hypothetical protein JW847_00585 [Candidatus Omnitrophica bacterium]|nr:hypothetical protein [Candidatus Omnitrophota bacterium]
MEQTFRNSKKKNKARSLDSINRGLVILVILLLGYVLSKCYAPIEHAVLMPDDSQAASREVAPVVLLSKEVKPFRAYEERVLKRDPFKPVNCKVEPNTTHIQKTMPTLYQRIKLIGILLDGDSKAVVEDIKENQIHFLSKGESFESALLKDIKEDKVIFIYNGERIEMAP